jgi:plastocyanin
MRMSYVLLAVVAIGCGGGGGSDGYGTGPGTGTGTGTGTGSGTGTASGTASVAMQQSDDGYGTATFSFSPSTVTVTKGGIVTWSNAAGTVAHNVTFSSAGSPANVGNMTSGSASRTFNTAGTYSYSCTNHPSMTGTVTVQ